MCNGFLGSVLWWFLVEIAVLEKNSLSKWQKILGICFCYFLGVSTNFLRLGVYQEGSATSGINTNHEPIGVHQVVFLVSAGCVVPLAMCLFNSDLNSGMLIYFFFTKYHGQTWAAWILNLCPHKISKLFDFHLKCLATGLKKHSHHSKSEMWTSLYLDNWWLQSGNLVHWV